MRLEFCMTQGAFAEFVGVHRITVNRWETGVTLVPDKMARLILLLAEKRRAA